MSPATIIALVLAWNSQGQFLAAAPVGMYRTNTECHAAALAAINKNAEKIKAQGIAHLQIACIDTDTTPVAHGPTTDL